MTYVRLVLEPELRDDVIDGVVKDWDLALDEMHVGKREQAHCFPRRVAPVVSEDSEACPSPRDSQSQPESESYCVRS